MLSQCGVAVVPDVVVQVVDIAQDNPITQELVATLSCLFAANTVMSLSHCSQHGVVVGVHLCQELSP